jgi:hypothetical protein
MAMAISYVSGSSCFNIPRPVYFTVFVNCSCHTKNKFTGILGIKKEPNGSDVKNIK